MKVTGNTLSDVRVRSMTTENTCVRNACVSAVRARHRTHSPTHLAAPHDCKNADAQKLVTKEFEHEEKNPQLQCTGRVNHTM